VTSISYTHYYKPFHSLSLFGILFGKISLQGVRIMENTIEHILLADDDKDHAVLFERMIRKDYPSLKISYVNDGEQLIHFLHLNKVDLLFLDLNMPCKNGYQCLQEIRKDFSLKELPIVVYSSSAHMSDIQKSFLHRADFYLVKPFNSDHLKTALNAILSVDWKEDPFIRNHYFINNRFVPYTATA
jgi:CheY-like chemotaxis protein